MTANKGNDPYYSILVLIISRYQWQLGCNLISPLDANHHLAVTNQRERQYIVLTQIEFITQRDHITSVEQ